MIKKIFLLLVISLFADGVYSGAEHPAVTATINSESIVNFNSYSPEVKDLLSKAIALTRQNLNYHYGSANPATGGMDCSGTVYYLLQQEKITTVPRASNEQFLWAQQQGKLHAVQATDFNSAEFAALRPGDLLFWKGTYAIKRYPAITHVMIYLGKNQQGRPLMIGASDGRTYLDKKMWGVSVFDFKLPAAGSASHFVGYGCIPGYTC